MVSDMPFGAAAIGDRMANPLQNDDEHRRRAAATVRVFFTMVFSNFEEDYSFVTIEDEEGFPAINDRVGRRPMLLLLSTIFLLHCISCGE